MNRYFKTGCFTFFLAIFSCAYIYGYSFSDYLDQQASIEQNNYINTQKQIEQANAAQEAAKEASEATQQQEADDQKQQNIPAAPPAITNTTVQCNCYDNSDNNNNIANNFLYNQNGERVFRKNPACKCFPKQNTTNLSSSNQMSNVINPLASGANSDYNQNNGPKNSSNNPAPQPAAPIDFGIKY